jgi:hypothetical protein
MLEEDDRNWDANAALAQWGLAIPSKSSGYFDRDWDGNTKDWEF